MPTTRFTLSPEEVLKSKDFTRFSQAASLEHDLDLPCSWRAGHPGAFRDALPLPGGTAEGRGRAENRDRCGLRELQAPALSRSVSPRFRLLAAFPATRLLFSFARAESGPAKSPPSGWSTNRRSCARGWGRTRRSPCRTSSPKAIRSRSSGRGFVQHLLWPAAKFLFQGLQFGQQRLRRLARSRASSPPPRSQKPASPAGNPPAWFARAKTAVRACQTTPPTASSPAECSAGESPRFAPSATIAQLLRL